MRMSFTYGLLLLLVLLVISCNPLKKIPEGEALYNGSTIELDSTTLTKKQKKELKTELKGLLRPKPNKKFLGMRLKLTAYYAAGNPKKESSPAGWMKNKLGEPPVLMSDFGLDRNTKLLQNTLENKGFFNAQTTVDTTIHGKIGKAHFHILVGERYFIKEVHFDTVKTEVQTNINLDSTATLLKPGDPYDLKVAKDERIRIDEALKQRGFYFFSPEFLILRVDSSIGNHQVNMYVRIKPNTPTRSLAAYRINDIYIFPNFRANSNAADTTKSDMEFYDGYYILDKRHRYKPRLFKDAMQFKPGELYNRTDHNATLSRLINMGMFRFVKNRLEPVAGIDSAKLNSYYYLTPMPRQSLRTEVNASTKSNNLTGSSLTLSWRKRNTFRGGELLSLEATGGFEVQFGGNFKGYNTYRGGLEGSLSFPRFIEPFHIRIKSSFVPKTLVTVGFDILTKQKLYKMNSIYASFGYAWKSSQKNEFKLNPFVINYVQPAYITQQYLDSIRNNPYLAKAITTQFIIGSNFNYNYSEITGNIFTTGIYFNGNIDLSGNVVGLITNASMHNRVKIFDGYFSQYVRGEVDFRYYFKLSKYKVWTNRIILGGSVPYGNSYSLPFVKQFFSGGNNSLRGFRSRSVGPGIYKPPDNSDFLPDQSGDIKLEGSTELRGKLFSIVHGAIFIDAGNIWLYREDTLNFTAGASFSKSFLRELAVDAGVGIRFDISFLVLRFDLGMPLRKPYLPDGQRWVLNQIDFGSSQWRKDNLIFNLAIGYPF